MQFLLYASTIISTNSFSDLFKVHSDIFFFHTYFSSFLVLLLGFVGIRWECKGKKRREKHNKKWCCL